MMPRSPLTLLALFSTASAFDFGFLRGGSDRLDQFTCTLSGGTDQDTCDATKSEDGSKCVWCTIATFGFCVSEDVAEKMKGQIPGLECDDDDNTDDAATDDATDDQAPVTDDTAPNDDSVPDDYWNCLKKYSDSTNCTSAGCAWCDTTGGFGICMDKDAAASAAKSDWFDCKMPDPDFHHKQPLADPYDPTCIAVSLQGDKSSCKATLDADGNACEWCSIGSYEFCFNDEQAQIAEQIGGSCGENIIKQTFVDPYDPSCIAVSLSGDEDTCKETQDADGSTCEWCTIGTTQLCVNMEQAQIAQQVGASCGDGSLEEDFVVDPYDPSCIAISLSGDESQCTDAKDSDGMSCEWCTIAKTNLCLNGDQAEIAQQVGASCGASSMEEDQVDPYDPTCIAVTLQGDESSCKATMDADGNACEWCSIGTTELCLNEEQAQIAEQIGGSCNAAQTSKGLITLFY